MIDKTFIYETLIPHLEKTARKIDLYLIRSLFENMDQEIVGELATFQNEDGGFGNALEPDNRYPGSSILATSTGVKILHEVRNKELKLPMIEQIVRYYESQYDPIRKGFKMIPKESDEYPHAVWWNYEDLEKNFPFGNPDPEVIGFMYKYRQFLTKLNIIPLINEVVGYILSDRFLEAGMHELFSVMHFYKRVDEDVKNLIHDRIHTVASRLLDEGLGKWEEYNLEPYKVFVVEPHFCNTHLEALGRNLQGLIQKLKTLKISPAWQWYQYELAYEQAKKVWTGVLYFDVLKALRRHHII